jgi:valyl-tRNA synthetase
MASEPDVKHLGQASAAPAVRGAVIGAGSYGVGDAKPAVGRAFRCRTPLLGCAADPLDEEETKLTKAEFVESISRDFASKKAAGDAVRDGRTQLHPPEMAKRYFDWVDNLHDWCISRQLWWGHRIPIWYGPNGEVVCVGPDEEPPAGEGWTQDGDVLDTWFSSGLWPFSTLGWPEETASLAKFYPNSVLVTGYDILFFWVARMMMFGLYAADGAPPFREVLLHGMVRDEHGKKMSKSFGNVVDPMDWIERYGADATRFTMARGANPGTDVPVSEEWCAGARNFAPRI